MYLKPSTKILFFLVITSVVACFVGCGPGSEPTLVLEVRSLTLMSNITVMAKQYRPDGTVVLYPEMNVNLDTSNEEYLTTVNGDPLRIRVDFDEPGRYAVHLVGEPIDNPEDRLIATICQEVDGVVSSSGIVLGRITAELDADGDTFPENLQAFCEAQAVYGIRCDTTCAGPEWLAMEDCNPPLDYEFPETCSDELGPNERWNPFEIDTCGDCHDQDCWNGDAPCETSGCSDDPNIHPGAEEICGDGIDNNCTIEIPACLDGDIPCDEDGDGFRAIDPEFEGCGSDCDDTDANINPSIPEGYGSDPDDPFSPVNCGDGIDNNCDGQIDERCTNDFDGDGIARADDCNDCNAAIGTGMTERCGNSIDEDCDGVDASCSGNDRDRDGVDAAPAGSDCDDSNPRTYPGAPDRCGDGQVSNCSLDISCSEIVDADGDGFGLDDTDCNDGDASINPWATELCDIEGIDEDCDGVSNEVPLELAAQRGCGFDADIGQWVELDFTSNDQHCGGCHHSCQLGNWYREGDRCEGGICVCDGRPDSAACGGDPTSYCCPDGCRDLTTDVTNCGACGNACVRNESCEIRLGDRLGRCICEASGSACDVALYDACCPEIGCTNTATDIENCGDCGNSCTEGERPAGDRCSPERGGCVCGDTQEVCTGSTWCTEVTETPAGRAACGCADLLTDVNNCGQCGVTCQPGESCVDGECACAGSDEPCDEDETCCSAGCVNLERDENNCGTCGTSCIPGEECDGGDCVCGWRGSCARGSQVCCSGTCRNVLIDESNCGPVTDLSGCGNTCDSGVECIGGSCSCGGGGSCGDDETCCYDSYCADLANETENCGDCGNRCRVGETCSSGECVCTPGCDDGDACTTDSCVGGRCEHHTRDNDGDGYCDEDCPDEDSGSLGDCINGDCDDSNGSINPGASESCLTSFDDDCDDSTNDENAVGCIYFYADGDGDSYGSNTNRRCQCQANSAYPTNDTGDCNDGDASINPGELDVCNGIDDDCTSATDDGDDDCPGYCCGAPAMCQECCSDSQCPACCTISWHCGACV